jgi:hypothetical protein
MQSELAIFFAVATLIFGVIYYASSKQCALSDQIFADLAKKLHGKSRKGCFGRPSQFSFTVNGHQMRVTGIIPLFQSSPIELIIRAHYPNAHEGRVVASYLYTPLDHLAQPLQAKPKYESVEGFADAFDLRGESNAQQAILIPEVQSRLLELSDLLPQLWFSNRNFTLTLNNIPANCAAVERVVQKVMELSSYYEGPSAY